MKPLLQLLTAVAIGSGSAWAQPYPQKTVVMVVPYAPGGTTDLVARILATELGALWGRGVVVDNRPGAAGNIGAGQVARAEPDGHTLLLTAAAPLTINKDLFANMGFDPEKDFAPIRLIATAPLMLVVNAKTPVRSVRELIDHARARPNQVSFGHSGVGTTSQLAGALFTSMAQVEITPVPYKGSAPALNDLLAGTITMLFDTVPSMMPHVRGGKVAALAVATRNRTAAAPDLPTIAEAGLPGYEVSTWFGLVGPAATPPAVVQAIDAALGQILGKPAIAARFRELGAEPGMISTSAFAAFLKSETAVFSKIVKAAGATPQ